MATDNTKLPLRGGSLSGLLSLFQTQPKRDNSLAAATTAYVDAKGLKGTPDTATVACTASTQVVIAGTKFQLATGELAVGDVYRFRINLIKTAAGTATWTAKLCFGVNGTNADTAVATFTSGTNTAAIDQAELEIIARVTATGSGTSATFACVAHYTNTLTNATGFGNIAPVPGATAGFDSTVATPWLHVDITQGASAVVTAVGMAERIA